MSFAMQESQSGQLFSAFVLVSGAEPIGMQVITEGTLVDRRFLVTVYEHRHPAPWMLYFLSVKLALRMALRVALRMAVRKCCLHPFSIFIRFQTAFKQLSNNKRKSALKMANEIAKNSRQTIPQIAEAADGLNELLLGM
ncbi:MAG: hypothetical protein IJ865_07510 [Clostridia bacterium]|nr:hypothetical protein [Clostridia bacterium]